MKNNLYIKRASIWRILINSTFNVMSILFLLFLLGQLFLVALPHTYLKVIVIGLIVGDVALIAAITWVEYRYSFFVIDEEKISYYQPLNKKKVFERHLSDVQKTKVISSSLLIEFNDQKILLDYLSKPHSLHSLINKKRALVN